MFNHVLPINYVNHYATHFTNFYFYFINDFFILSMLEIDRISVRTHTNRFDIIINFIFYALSILSFISKIWRNIMYVY